MRSFDELTKAGRVARLRLLAIDALRDQFDINPRRVSLLASHSFNTLFRADLTDGQRLAVRVGEVRIHAEGVEEVEADWLAALRAQTDIGVPTLTADRHGRHVVATHHPLVPGTHYCSAMTWIAGHTVRDRFDHDVARGMGATLALLHEQASRYEPPEIPPGIVANRVLYFGDTSLLSNYQSTYGSMFVDAIDRVQTHLDALWFSPPHEPHLLHGDFGPQNVMRFRGRLTPIDFQDLQFGFDVQDVAITVSDLRRLFNEESLIETFVAGYTSVRPWPLEDPTLERALAAQRRLGFINLGLILQRPGLSEFTGRNAEYIAGWMGLSPRATLI